MHENENLKMINVNLKIMHGNEILTKNMNG